MYGKSILGMILLVFLLATALVGPAVADTESQTLAHWNELDGRIAELEKQVKIAELERKLAEQSDELPNITLPPVPMNVSMPEVKPAAATTLPKVHSIHGSQGALEATLQWEDGSQRVVQVGNGLPNGGKVILITANRVVAQRVDGGSEALSFVPLATAKSERRR